MNAGRSLITVVSSLISNYTRIRAHLNRIKMVTTYCGVALYNKAEWMQLNSQLSGKKFLCVPKICWILPLQKFQKRKLNPVFWIFLKPAVLWPLLAVTKWSHKWSQLWPSQCGVWVLFFVYCFLLKWTSNLRSLFYMLKRCILIF
jgi:hypothetical protein